MIKFNMMESIRTFAAEHWSWRWTERSVRFRMRFALAAVFVTYGPWSVDLPEDLEPYRKEIEELVNSEVPQGCCGGCI